MRNDNCLLTGERGSAMVELAICAPVLCLLFVGSIEFHKLTNYKRKVIGATRYACWEVVARKGEANLEKTVATEMRNLWFPEISFDANSAVVQNFTADNSQGSGVQLKVEKMSSLGDLTSSGALVYGTTVGYAAGKAFELGPIKLGYGLASSNPDDRIKTTVRMTYKPTFFPVVMNFMTLKESQVQDASRRPRSWNVDKNLMSVGGDVTFARMVLCNGTWDEYRRDQLIERVKGMWCPVIGQILSEISGVTFGIVEFKCYVEPDLVCPTTYTPGDNYQDVRQWWQRHENPSGTPCKCTHPRGPQVRRGRDIADPNRTMEAEKQEYLRELRQRIADDTRRIGEIDEEIRQRQSDDNPNNDDVSALRAERERLEADRTAAQAEIDRVNAAGN